MPNWAEGTLKIRGTKENIVNFLKNELLGKMYPIFSKEEDGTPKVEYGHKEVLFKENEWGDIEIKCEGGFYIGQSRRAFIENSSLDIEFLDEDIEQVELEGFKQAWAAVPENYQVLSKKYQLDMKIFTFECGMEFTQEIEIQKGELIKNKEKEYSDWFWEVPFSKMGG